MKILPDYITNSIEEIILPTQLEIDILNKLNKGKFTTSELATHLNKLSPSISRTLTLMMQKGWVTRVGIGKRAYYSISVRGLSALKRGKNKS
jgi:DNA-binding HxlR family transcriptional regulator